MTSSLFMLLFVISALPSLVAAFISLFKKRRMEIKFTDYRNKQP